MTTSAETLTPEQIETARERLTPRGLMARQMRIRIRQFWPRQSMTLVGSIALAAFVSPIYGMVAACIALIGETIDQLTLRHAISRLGDPAQFIRIRMWTSLSGMFHAVTISMCILLAHDVFPGGQGFQFSLIFLFGAVMSAGLFLAYHPWSSVARLTVYFLVYLYLIYAHFFGAGHASHHALVEAATALILALVTSFLLQFAYSNQIRQIRINKKLLDQSHSLQLAHEARDREKDKSRDLALVARHANDSVIITDPEGKITWVNQSFTRLTGYGLDDAAGKYPGTLLNSENTDPATVQLIIDKITAGEQLRTEVLNKTKAGNEIWVEVNLVPVKKEDGSLDKVISIERDITEAREKADALATAKLAAERSEKAKSEFLATISHEIRTPMNAILGTAELLEAANLPEEERIFAKTIKESSAALLEILNATLDLSKLEAGKLSLSLEPFDLHEAILGATNLFRASAMEKGLSLDGKIAENLPRFVIGDLGRMRQILLNLLGNAIKFTTEGKISIAASARVEDAQVMVEIQVSDTGIGIPADRLDQIFDEFSQAEASTTRRFGGTGLGLTISRKLARMMGGNIVVTSDKGQGSVFTVSLELEIDRSQSGSTSNHPVAENPPDLSGMRVLAADDNETNLFLLSKYFKDQAVAFSSATDGNEAVARAEMERPDVVLMDMSMPQIDGPTAARKIRALAPPFVQPVIIALTANYSAQDHQICIDAGMDDVLTKPIRKDDLIRKLGEYWPAEKKDRAISL